MAFSGFRYYHAQTITPNFEHVFELVTLLWLLVLTLSFFHIRRHLESRTKKRQSRECDEIRKEIIESDSEEDVSVSLNYAPFIDNAKSHVGADQLLSSEQGEHRKNEQAGGSNLVRFLSRIRTRGRRKEEQDEWNHFNSNRNGNVSRSQHLLGLAESPSYTPTNEAIDGSYASSGIQRYDEPSIVILRKHNEQTSSYIDSIDDTSTMSGIVQKEACFPTCNDETLDGRGMTVFCGAEDTVDESARQACFPTCDDETLDGRGMAVLCGAEDAVDERVQQAVEVLPHINDRGGWDDIVIYETSIFQVNPFATRNLLHDSSGPFRFESGRCIDVGYESDSPEDDGSPQFIPSEEFDDDLPDYGTQPWDDLPPDVKLAAEALGIDQAMWAAKIKSKIFKRHWDELTIPQQAACIQLGLTKRKWEQRFVLDDFQLPSYKGYKWRALPRNAVAAAEVLGYSKKMWDNNQDSELCKKRWKELSEEQQAASLALLGIDEVSWDANWLTEKTQRKLRCVSTFEHYAWQDLPPKAQKAAMTLGYDKKLWDSNQDTDLFVKKWKKLNPEQQAAAIELHGCDQRWWDEMVRYKCLLNAISWEHLPGDAKGAATALGYSKEVWDKVPKPSIFALKWNMMNPSHRATWFQLLVSLKSQKEQDPNLKSTQRPQKRAEQELICGVSKETRNLLRLACTAAVANLGKPILPVLLMGLILGTTGAYIFIAWIMVNFLLDMCEFTTAGFIEAEQSMCRQAIAVKKYFQAAQQVQLSLGLCTLVTIPIYVLIAFLIDDILISLSFGGTVGEFAREYAPLAVLSRLIQGCLANGLNRLMWSDGRGSSMVKLELIAKILQFAFLLLMLVGLQIDSITGIGLIEVVVSILYSALIFKSCVLMGWLAKYEKGLMEYWSLRNKSWAGEFVKMSIPLNTGHILSHGHWLIWTWFAVAMGPAEAAAWIIMQALGVVLVVLPTAITNATEIQVGLSIGSGRTEAARQIALRSLLYVAITSLVPPALFFGFQDPIIGYFTDDRTFFLMMQSLVPLVCTGTVIHALASHSQMILGSIGRAKVGIVTFYVGTYGLSLPLACAMVFGARFGLQSLMMSVVLGNSIIAFTNLLAVYSSDWSSMSRKVLIKAEKHRKALKDTTRDRVPSRKKLEMC